MNPNENKPNFMDRGTITAIIVMLVFWFGWTKYMEMKYPPQPATPVATAPDTAAPAVTGATTAPAIAAAPGTAPTTAASAGQVAEETSMPYDGDNMSFSVSSRGMGLRGIDIKKYKTRTNEPIILGGVPGDFPFATNAIDGGQPLNFKIEQPTPGTFVGHATLGDAQVEKTMKINNATYSIDTTIAVTGNLENFHGLSTSMSEVIQVPEQGGMLGNSSREYQDWFCARR